MKKNTQKTDVANPPGKNVCEKCKGPTVVTQSSVTCKFEKCLHCGHKKKL